MAKVSRGEKLFDKKQEQLSLVCKKWLVRLQQNRITEEQCVKGLFIELQHNPLLKDEMEDLVYFMGYHEYYERVARTALTLSRSDAKIYLTEHLEENEFDFAREVLAIYDNIMPHHLKRTNTQKPKGFINLYPEQSAWEAWEDHHGNWRNNGLVGPITITKFCRNFSFLKGHADKRHGEFIALEYGRHFGYHDHLFDAWTDILTKFIKSPEDYLSSYCDDMAN